MIQLYHKNGSAEVQILDSPILNEEWNNIRRNACRLLRTRNEYNAAQLLESLSFELCGGTNSFGDEFSLLYLNAPLNQYVELAEQKDATTKLAFNRIAETIAEIGSLYIRFIVAELDNEVAYTVPVPTLTTTSDIIERALADCEQLIHSRGAISGVDRIHTAFHGYLRAVCTKNGITMSEDAGITQLFKTIRKQHPNFVEQGPRTCDIERIIYSMATIIDSLNPLRNQATLAHPNNEILEEAEAMLVINAVRTLLHYLNAKMK